MIRPLALALLSATPVLAQEAPTSALIMDLFITRCAEIAADPEAAVAQSFDPDRAPGILSQMGDITTDKALLFYLEESKGDAFGLSKNDYAAFSFNREKLLRSTISGCMLQYTFGGETGLPSIEEIERRFSDLPGVIEAKLGEAWGGPVARAGGNTNEASDSFRRFVWSYGDSFPPSRQLTLGQTGSAIILISTTHEAVAN